MCLSAAKTEARISFINPGRASSKSLRASMDFPRARRVHRMPTTRGKRRLFYEFFKQFGRVLQVGVHQRDRVARGGIKPGLAVVNKQNRERSIHAFFQHRYQPRFQTATEFRVRCKQEPHADKLPLA
jgi:hypothetical protein